jgi:hypothetical protein
MPCSFEGSRSLVFKQLATGIAGRNGVFGALSGQFPANNQPIDGLRGRGFISPGVPFVATTAKDVGTQTRAVLKMFGYVHDPEAC